MKRDRDLEKEKVESLYVTREMAEDKEMDEKIRQDLIHAADQAEKEFQEEEALGAPRMKPEEKQQLFDDIVGELKKKGIWEESPEDQLSAEDREALRLGRELLNNPKKKRSAVIHKIFKGVAGAAVVAVGVFVLSMSSEANRVKVLSVWNNIVNDGLRVNFDRGNQHNYDNIDEQKMYAEIEDMGIRPIKLMYIPEGMVFKSYNINKISGLANVYYEYNGTLFTIYMYAQESNSSFNQNFDGKIIDSVKTYIDDNEINICQLESGVDTYAIEFEYEETYYSIWGSMEEEEFKKIISEITF